MGRPGIMLYFDMLEPIQVLTNAERGKLLTAILEYGKEGKKPDFRGKLALAWGFVQPKLDRDENSYDMAVLQRKYAGFCSRRSYNGLQKIEFEDWLAMDEQQRKYMVKADGDIQQPLTAVNGCAPTTAASTTTTAKTNTITNTNTSLSSYSDPYASTALSQEAKDAAERKRLKVIYGNMRRGDGAMTEKQIDDLLDKIGSGKFEHYLSRLNNCGDRSGSFPQKDYVRMIKWWTEDVAC